VEALRRRALTVTMMHEPDMERAAISGRRVSARGANTPAAMGSARVL
jgi:hypothetical protein